MQSSAHRFEKLPSWIPEGAQHYIAHTEAGVTIRELARKSGLHASTVLRQIRKVETRRDDPLIDSALRRLGAEFGAILVSPATSSHVKESAMSVNAARPESPEADSWKPDAMRILRRLCERGAVLAVATDMEKAVVVRENAAGSSQRTAVVDRGTAESMALREWISADRAGRITRYKITTAGRSALEEMLGEPVASGDAVDEAQGFAEAQTPFADQHREWGDKRLPDPEDGRSRRFRYNLAESPLTALARRRDKDGTPFLSDDLVSAGERLREDFELAQMGPRVAQNWDRFLTGGGRGGFAPDSGIGNGPDAARARVASALETLGPGLGDVALRCCCYLEGLETAEKTLGWSARSGKIVLRIALLQLKRHYESLSSSAHLIG